MDGVVEADNWVTILVTAICAVTGSVYSAIAFNSGVYKPGGVLAVVGYILDITWSLINSIAGLFVWAGIILSANWREPNPCHPQRNQSAPGRSFSTRIPAPGYQACTVGTVIAGGWSTHEEIHL